MYLVLFECEWKRKTLEAMKSHPGPRLLSRRACCVAAMYGEDEVLIAGGFDDFASVSSTEFIHLFNLKPTAVAEPFHVRAQGRVKTRC